jgi:hypothetical protein
MTESTIDRSWEKPLLVHWNGMRPFSFFWQILYMQDEIIHAYRYYRRKKDD